MDISILGAGSWGTSLGQVLSDNKHSVKIWHYNEKFISRLQSTHIHPFLPEFTLNKSIKFTSSLNDLLDYGDVLISAIPSHTIRSLYNQFPKNWSKLIVSASKGIENESGMCVSEIIRDCLNFDNIAVLSGPSHAEEVIRKNPTAIVSACSNIELARKIQRLFSNQYFRVYSSKDIVGVEIGGATKNIIAIAAGICSGLGYGDNTMAALVTRGLEEIKRLGMLRGAKRSTFSGLSGMGDLVVTAFSPHSRNREVGFRIGQGETLDDILLNMEMVAEGVTTTKSIYNIIKNKNIDMPICEKIYEVLFNNIDPRTAILDLMGRDLIDEHKV